MGSSKLPFKELQENAPERMGFEAIQTLDRGYLLTGETPNAMIDRLCNHFITFYPNGYNGFSQKYLYNRLHEAFSKCWFMGSTPVLANFGTKRGLPTSCYGQNVQNSLDDIFKCSHESAMLTKGGGGLGIDLSNLIGVSKVTSWAKIFDTVMTVCNQANVRRGNAALYLDAHHPDLDLFLEAHDLTKGDAKQKITCNIAIKFDTKFRQKLEDGDPKYVKIFSDCIRHRFRFGSPYFYFTDNVIDQDPKWYKDKGLKTSHSNLCNEIFLYSDRDHTYSCMLSNINLLYEHEWSQYDGLTMGELAILFLDAVNEDFIIKASSSKYPDGYRKAVNGAIKGRPLGLGIFGLAALFMSKDLPFDSDDAKKLNKELFQRIYQQAEKATRILAKEKGEPEWCKGWNRRNTHLMSQPPTTSSSLIGGGITPGIQPILGNIFSKIGAKGNFVRKNPFLESKLEQYGKNNDDVWNQIRKDGGSVQNLNFLSEHDKLVFRTAWEISQNSLVKMAADRQQFIDQGQSLNLFFKPDADAQKVVDTHLLAWDLGLKGLYYLYSESYLNKNDDDLYIYMGTRDDCTYCQKAKKLLDDLEIFYVTGNKPEGRVPEIWINGEKLDDGYTSLVEYLDISSVTETSGCSGCEG